MLNTVHYCTVPLTSMTMFKSRCDYRKRKVFSYLHNVHLPAAVEESRVFDRPHRGLGSWSWACERWRWISKSDIWNPKQSLLSRKEARWPFFNAVSNRFYLHLRKLCENGEAAARSVLDTNLENRAMLDIFGKERHSEGLREPTDLDEAIHLG